MTLDRLRETGGVSAAQISTDTLPYGFVGNIQQAFNNRLFNPNLDPTATDRLVELRDSWQESGKTTVFTTGLYDVLHMDHMGYLLHTKLAGAAIHYGRTEGGDWENLAPVDQLEFTRQALCDNALRLIVSVDGDESARVRKAFKPGKGQSPRPIYAWPTRALMVAGQSVIDPSDPEGARLLSTVDAVTIHGPDDFPAESVHHIEFDLAATLQPDAWVVFGESQDIIDEAPQREELQDIPLRVINDGVGAHYFEDKFMGKMSTTRMVERVKGVE